MFNIIIYTNKLNYCLYLILALNLFKLTNSSLYGVKRMEIEPKEISSQEMIIQDINSEYLGIPRYLLMENAGSKVTFEINNILRNKKNSRIAIFCGIGGNGGDGLVTARHLHGNNEVSIFIIGSEIQIKSLSTKKNFQAIKKLANIKFLFINDSSNVKNIDLDKFDLIVDGLLGTGLKEFELKEPVKSIVNLINNRSRKTIPVVSIDVPTGLKIDGTVTQTFIRPDYTIALHNAKFGTYKYGGIVKEVTIGIPPESRIYTGPGLYTLYPKRKNDSHKGQNGKIAIIGGSNVYHGAVLLAAKAALALNVDLVTLIVPESISSAIRSQDYRIIVKTYNELFLKPIVIDSVINPILETVDAILVGPGIGKEHDTLEAVRILIKSWNNKKTLIIDADAIIACKELTLPEKTIITPHIQEFNSLLGSSLKSNQNFDEKLDSVKKAIKAFNQPVTWLVKGPIDIICKQGELLLNRSGTPSMTTGGTGDVLAGLTTAMSSKINDSFVSAGLAAFIIGLAGEMADKDIFSIQKLIENIPIIMKELEKFINEEPNWFSEKE